MQNNFFRKTLGIISAAIVFVVFPACGSDNDDYNVPENNEDANGLRLKSIDGMPLNYDADGKMTSITTSRWGNVMWTAIPTFENGFLTKFQEDRDIFNITWSGGNPSSMSGGVNYCESKATAYGETCRSAAFCTAFNLYVLWGGDAYKPHNLGVFYGQVLNGNLGKNANRLITHLEYHDGDELSCDYKFEKDANGNITRVIMNIVTKSYKNGNFLGTSEKTETINLSWEDSTGINGVQVGKTPGKVQTISGMNTGRKANDLKEFPKGVYIVDGKKIVKSK
ncbi:MAG: hypothetical protein IJ605_07715 [Prevotella sp.]|nr:hypothetical protein [Prevotella sp.]